MLADDLGLTRDQFTQVVLLPQGEFARFLRANDDERRALLTKLFGTQLYDRITDELDRRRREVSGDLDGAAERLRRRVSGAGAAAGLSPADRTNSQPCRRSSGARGSTRSACGSTRRQPTRRWPPKQRPAHSSRLEVARGARTSAADRMRRFAQAARRRDEHEQAA